MKIPKTGNIQKKKSSTKNTMNISISVLDILCKYIITDPAYIKIGNVSTLNNMIRGLDPSTYENDLEKSRRINFIKSGIEARLKFNLTDRNMVVYHIVSNIGYDPDFVDINNTNLTIDEIEWCNNIISELIKYSFVDSYINQIMDVCQQIKTSDFDHRVNYINEFEHLLDMSKNEFRKAAVNDNIVDMEFNLDPREFSKNMTDIYNIVTSPSRRLMSGMQGLNTMIGGGFESGRVYMFLGITGVGKSITLLNLACQIKKYNTNYQLKDPSKIPVVVYLTMENSVIETVTRLFDLVTDSPFGMNSYSLDDVMRKMQEEGQLVISENNPINIFIKFKPNRSVDTSYLYTLYDDLHDKGYEPICIIQDHLLRIRSIYGNPEPRYELGDIVNEFKTFATTKDIPVISNFHLNREAMRVIEQFNEKEKLGKHQEIDPTQRLGKSAISESIMILNNADCTININKDEDNAGTRYLCFNLVKMRDKTDLFYFAQPFAYGGEIKLIEDVNGPVMYKENLHNRNEGPSISNVRTSSANAMNSISSIAQLNGPIDASFLDTPQYNTIDDFQIEEPVIRKKVAVDPFIRGLPLEDPRESVMGMTNGLDDLKSQLIK